MIGRDPPDQILAWIEDRIAYHIRDKESNPELHRLVTRYQMHKCSNYCKRKRKFGKVKNAKMCLIPGASLTFLEKRRGKPQSSE